MLSPGHARATYLIRLEFPDGTGHEVSGCDTHCDVTKPEQSVERLERAVRIGNVIQRWLHGETLHAHALPKRAVGEVFDLRRDVRRKKVVPLAVEIQVVLIVVSPEGFEHEEIVWDSTHTRTDPGAAPAPPHFATAAPGGAR
jgi:hypothetical protein